MNSFQLGGENLSHPGEKKGKRSGREGTKKKMVTFFVQAAFHKSPQERGQRLTKIIYENKGAGSRLRA